MNFIETYGKELVALLVPFLTWVLNVGFKAKVKMMWTSPHSFTHLVKDLVAADGGQPAKPGTLHTASLIIWNAGRETATNVQVVFNQKPPQLNIWPVRPMTEHLDSDGRFTLSFESFAPKEELRIEMISLHVQVPGVLQIRSDQQVAQSINTRVVRRLPNWANRAIAFLVLAGISSVVYWTITLTQLLVLRTPV